MKYKVKKPDEQYIRSTRSSNSQLLKSDKAKSILAPIFLKNSSLDSGIETIIKDFTRNSICFNNKGLDEFYLWVKWLNQTSIPVEKLSPPEQDAYRLVREAKITSLSKNGGDASKEQKLLMRAFIQSELDIDSENLNHYIINYIQGHGNNYSIASLFVGATFNSNHGLELNITSKSSQFIVDGVMYGASGGTYQISHPNPLKIYREGRIQGLGLLKTTARGNELISIGGNLEIVQKILTSEDFGAAIFAECKDIKSTIAKHDEFEERQKKIYTEHFERIRALLATKKHDLVFHFIPYLDVIKNILEVNLPDYVDELDKINQFINGEDAGDEHEVLHIISRYFALYIIDLNRNLNKTFLDIHHKLDRAKNPENLKLKEQLLNFQFFYLKNLSKIAKLNQYANRITTFLIDLKRELPSQLNAGNFSYLAEKIKECEKLIDAVNKNSTESEEQKSLPDETASSVSIEKEKPKPIAKDMPDLKQQPERKLENNQASSNSSRSEPKPLSTKAGDSKKHSDQPKLSQGFRLHPRAKELLDSFGLTNIEDNPATFQ